MEHKHSSYPLAIRQVEENGLFSGYASIFNIRDLHNDVILPGAFNVQGTLPLLWQHKPEEPIGVINTIREDKRGLFVEGKLLLDVQRAKEAYTLLKSGVTNGLSIGFKVDDYTIDPQTGVRNIHRVALFEISLVTFPANPEAQITSVKMHEEEMKQTNLPTTIRAFEEFLRDAGYSRRVAKAIATHGFQAAFSDETPCDAALSDGDLLTIDAALDSAFIRLCS